MLETQNAAFYVFIFCNDLVLKSQLSDFLFVEKYATKANIASAEDHLTYFGILKIKTYR